MSDDYDEQVFLETDDELEHCTFCGVSLNEYQVMYFEDEPYCTHCFPHEIELEDI